MKEDLVSALSGTPTENYGQWIDEALHASAPEGYECVDCTMDKEPCPRCYRAWWQKRHPNTILLGDDEMSHHGNYDPKDSEAMRALMNDMLKKEQKTLQGEFPAGRLNAQDEGGIAVGIGHQAGKVVMSFPNPTAWIGFTPEQAIDMATSLVEHARACGCTVPLTLKIGAK